MQTRQETKCDRKQDDPEGFLAASSSPGAHAGTQPAVRNAGGNRRRVPDIVRRSRSSHEEAADNAPNGVRAGDKGSGRHQAMGELPPEEAQQSSFAVPPPTPSQRPNNTTPGSGGGGGGSSGSARRKLGDGDGTSGLGGGMDFVGGGVEGKHDEFDGGEAAVAGPGSGAEAISRRTEFSGAVSRLVLKFTTLSDGSERASFCIDTHGGSIGRSASNQVSVPSDSTLSKMRHAMIEHRDGLFQLVDSSTEYHAAVRVGVGRAAPAWPVPVGAAFSAGNSVFSVESLDEAVPRLVLHVRTGPLKGETIVITQSGATLGRATDNTVCIPDRELSRRHSRIHFDPNKTAFLVSDLGSTNGTYVQLVGPYTGRYPLHLNDHILVGRTGFSINRFDFGLSEEMGLRRTMEDKSILVQDMRVRDLSDSDSPQTWMGVYDGHGGPQASEFLWEQLHVAVSAALCDAAGDLRRRDKDEVVKAALTKAFLHVDSEFIATSATPQAGSTATTALLLGDRLYCANVGDSRTVLCRDGEAVALSADHKPFRDDEAARIKAAGGFIIHKRVMGELAVSRAFGDAEFKKGISEILGEEAPLPPEQPGEADLSKPLIVAEPEVQAITLESRDDFLLLACDGLFDVLSNQEACDYVSREMRAHGDAQRAAEALSRHAIDDLGSRDNVTILIVLLRDGQW